MKYVLLIYDNPETREAFFGEETDELMGEVDALLRELTESGELVGTEALADPSNTKTVRVRGGVPAVTDGPFAEAKEQFGGYYIVDCESAERAAEIAARWPDARYCAMEVRPLMEAGGDGDVRKDAYTEGLLRRAGAAGPRRARAPLRAVRRVRGRGPGGVAGRRHRSGPRRGCRSNPRGVADHGGLPPDDRRVAQRSRPPPARRDGCGTRGRPTSPSHRPRTTRPPRPGRHADPAVHVLPSGALTRLAGRAHAARRRRADHRARSPRAFLVPEATMAQRISRAKQSIKASGVPFRLPPEDERADRLRVVLHVLYLIFNEGYAATSGPDLRAQRADRRGDPADPRPPPAAARRRRGGWAARADAAHRRAAPGTHPARRRPCPARRAGPGALGPRGHRGRCGARHRRAVPGADRPVPTAGGDRRGARRGPRAEDTDWPQILDPVRVARAASPTTRWSHSTAPSRSRWYEDQGPDSTLLATLDAGERLTGHHRLDAVRAHLLEMAGDHAAACSSYRTAARRTTSLPEQRYLEARAARLAENVQNSAPSA